MFDREKPDLTGCDSERLNFGLDDPVKTKRTFEEATVCALIQIRNLLAKIAYSVTPAVYKSFLTEVGAEKFEEIYLADRDVVIEIQNVSNLSDSPNDLIIQPSFLKIKNASKDNSILGMVIKPTERMRLHLTAGNALFARFLTDPSYVVISELNF